MAPNLNAILHGQNSTALPVWHPNPTTIFLCVWQAIHLNIPPPGEPPYKQILRRVGWSILAIIAPEVVALNAWVQYRQARELMEFVNEFRGLSPRKLKQVWYKRLKIHLLWLGGRLGMICLSPINLADYLRMIISRRSDLRAYQSEQRRSKNDDLLSQLDSDRLPWTMATAFYALCGGAVIGSDYGMGETLSNHAIVRLADMSSASLLPLQKAVLQDPSKASGLAKAITCTQALWFCSQCFARFSEDMALSLLELNTFAHCISALCIYCFWWHKPYDVETHVYINDLSLYQQYLLWHAVDQMATESHSFAVRERNSSGDLITLAGADALISDHSPQTRHRHKIEHSETIPGTGFIIQSMSENRVFHASDSSLAYWKELWKVRVAFKQRETNLYEIPMDDIWRFCDPRAPNLDNSFFNSVITTEGGFLVPLIMILTFLAYGGIHLLAWQYNLPTKAEAIMWRSASIATSSSGVVILFFNAMHGLSKVVTGRFAPVVGYLNLGWIVLLASASVLARSFLFVESFRALPNSPASIYDVPRWTAYFPHI